MDGWKISGLDKIQITPKEWKRHGKVDRGKCNVYEFCHNWTPEIMLAKNYASVKGTVAVEDTVKTYWEFVKSNFIMVSHTDVQLYWPKYDYKKLDNSIYFDYHPSDSPDKCLIYNWGFTDWLNLYAEQIESSAEHEEFVHRPAAVATGFGLEISIKPDNGSRSEKGGKGE